MWDMIFEARNKNWERVRAYAMGEQNISKYKEAMKLNKGNPWINIDWKIKKGFMKRFIQKFWTRQPMKSYRMVARLKNNNH